MELTVGCLKELLMQQLRQQGAAEWSGQQLGEVELLLVQPDAVDAQEAAAVKAAAAAGVLGDVLTVAQLYERWWGVGPEVQVQYRLLLS
jgi:D-alanyl-D-alanine dipeptidase